MEHEPRWTEQELDLLTGAGCQRVSLGPNTLRIETAAVAIAAGGLPSGVAMYPSRLQAMKTES